MDKFGNTLLCHIRVVYGVGYSYIPLDELKESNSYNGRSESKMHLATSDEW